LPDGLSSNQKSQIWVNFGGSSNDRWWYILEQFGQFSGHLIIFSAIWYISWPFGMLNQVKSGNPD
jgi:hypothetical protein